MMTRRFQNRTAPAVSSIRWALGGAALLVALACRNDAEPRVQSEPPRAPEAASAPQAGERAAPGGQVSLAKYDEASAPKAAEAAAPAAVSPSAAAAPTADAPSAAAGQPVKGVVVDGDSFSTWLQAVSPVPAGTPATVEAVLVAKGGFHCNADYPHKFKLGAAPAGLSYPEATVKGMQVSAERSVLRIPVVAQSPGKATVSGTLQFSVCNDERCLIEKRELSLDLEVK